MAKKTTPGPAANSSATLSPTGPVQPTNASTLTPTPSPSRRQHVGVVWTYVKDKFKDGFCLGIGTFFFIIIPAFAGVGKGLANILLSIPLIVAAAGMISLLGYNALPPANTGNYVRRFFKAWFDFVQQFFCLSVGALPLITLANSIVSVTWEDAKRTLISGVASWVLYLFLAFLFGGSWALRDETTKQVPPKLVAAALVAIFVVVLIVIASVRIGGSSGLGDDIRQAFGGI